MAKSTAPRSDLLPWGLEPLAGQEFLQSHFAGHTLAGIDEVGRGPLAGPVVACVAVLRSDVVLPKGLTDSKKLSAQKRDDLYQAVQDACACFAIGQASVEEIDRYDILNANFLAMRRALDALGFAGLEAPVGEVAVVVKGQRCLSGTMQNPVHLLVDGNQKIRGVDADCQTTLVKGDGRVACIAAASVLAKVFRDRLMADLAGQYPGYGFEKHAGYGTAAHLDAIRRLGFSPVHRRSFKPKSLQGQMDLWG